MDLVKDFTGSFVVDVSYVGDGEKDNVGNGGDDGTLRVVFVDGFSVGVEPRLISSIALASFSYLLSWCHFHVELLAAAGVVVGGGIGVVGDGFRA